MEITEIRIKLMDEPGERLRAFCSITLDNAFVIRDLKIIEGTTGPFVAMPSRKLTARCGQCSCKNHTRAQFCNQCGVKLKPANASRDDDGRPKLYADIAHPINSACREMLQAKVVQAYELELAASQLPGYVPSYYDFDQEENHVELADSRSLGGAGGRPYMQIHGPHKVRAPRRKTSDVGAGSDHHRPDDFGTGVM
ncbi:MAG TPA: SpoVG family protein [Pirellulales bacterium]